MRFHRRLAVALVAMVVLAVGLSGCTPPPKAPPPYTVEHALQLEKEAAQTQNLVDKAEKLNQSFSIYDQIVRENHSSKPDVAADALYKAGEFAGDPARYGGSEQITHTGLDAAWHSWKQLYDEFPKQAKTLLLLDQPGKDKLAQVRDAVAKRNSVDWKYKIIDTLVGLTGRNPNFSYAIALALLALTVKMILLPLSKKQYQYQREMQKLQPLLKELQKKYKGADLSKAQMDLYKEHGVNPFASCLPVLIQMPFLIFIFSAIREYEPAFAHGNFLWVGSGLATAYPSVFGGNLALPDVPLLVGYTVTNYISMRMTPAPTPEQQQQQNSMALMTSGLFFYMFLSYKWSSAFVLYWFVLNLFSIWQTYEYVYKPHKERMANQPPEIVIPPSNPSNGTDNAKKNGTGSATLPSSSSSPSSEEDDSPARVRPRKKNRKK